MTKVGLQTIQHASLIFAFSLFNVLFFVYVFTNTSLLPQLDAFAYETVLLGTLVILLFAIGYTILENIRNMKHREISFTIFRGIAIIYAILLLHF